MNDLTVAVLSLVARNIQNGNIAQCLNLGFTPQEIKHISALSAKDISQLGESRVPIMAITVDHRSLISQIDRIFQQRLRERQIDRAIVLNGSVELLVHYFGLSTQEISMRRKLIGCDAIVGRCRQLTEVEESDVWMLWQDNRIEDVDSYEALDVMMMITEQLSMPSCVLPLAAVWTAIKQWEGNHG